MTSAPGASFHNSISAEFSSITHARGSPEYNSRLARYYSLQQQELRPNCVIKPVTSTQLSRVIQIAKENNWKFAVASGGHMCWSRSSSTADGFILDLRGLNQIEISAEDQTARLGPGPTWKDVYGAMIPFDVTTTGARINEVGVGGFLLGGGITFASAAKGFGADSVFGYEVVLADGAIVNASEDTHEDLFWALKLAGSNFGIVTRFDMHTYPSPAIWGAVSVYSFTEAVVKDLLADFGLYAHDNSCPEIFKAVVLVWKAGSELAMTVQVSNDGVRQDPMTAASHVHHEEKVGNTHDVVNEVVAAALESEARTQWYTLTTQVDTDFFKDLFGEGREIFKTLETCNGLQWVVSFQSFKRSLISRTARSPVYNALNRSGEDLVCILIMTTWEKSADDLDMATATKKLGAWGEAEARKRGILDEFIYLNYANGEQHVYERSVTPEDLARLQRIQKTYDPLGTFESLWQGGYKLPRQEAQ